MNLYKENNAFYDWLETNTIPTSAIALWHALMNINNKAGWGKEFAVARSVLMAKTGLGKDALYNARNILKQKGRINFKERGNKATIFEITSFYDYESELPSDKQTVAPTIEPTTPPTATPTTIQTINILDNTKLNNKKYIKKDLGIPYDEIVQAYNSSCKSLSKVKARNKKRDKLVKAAWNSFGSIDKVKEFFEQVESSDWLTGRAKGNDGWRADFDWILKEDKLCRILEGAYDNKKSKAASGANQTIDLSRYRPNFGEEM